MKLTSKDFKSFWKLNFPESLPIGHELRGVYPERWFRIHSLPESKRYAETKAEYQILFERQNQLIADLMGEGEEIILLFAIYKDDKSTYLEIKEFADFEKVDRLELHRLRPKEYEFYDEEHYLDVYIKSTKWESNKRNEILRLVAEDEIRMLIINPNKKRILYPYDGGLDSILESEKERDLFKGKYKAWLSKRPDGL